MDSQHSPITALGEGSSVVAHFQSKLRLKNPVSWQPLNLRANCIRNTFLSSLQCELMTNRSRHT